MTELSSSGFDRTRIRQAISNSYSSPIPVSFMPSRNPAGLRSSRIVRSGKISGTEYFVNIPRTERLFLLIRSAILIKIDSAMSSICSSSTLVLPPLRLDDFVWIPARIIILLISLSEPSEPMELVARCFEPVISRSRVFTSFRSAKNS